MAYIRDPRDFDMMNAAHERDEQEERLLTEEEKEELRKLRAERAYLAEHIDERTLEILEDRFMTNYPSYQRNEAGGYDPLDAMRRDANREVILWLRWSIEQSKKENNYND